MANQDVRVSALQSASTLSTEDLALATVVDELSETGYTSKKITEGAKASQYLEAFTFANLNTSAKTIVGAINEAATTGAGDFPIHINNSTITETAGEVIDAMADGLKPYVIWTNNAQSNYTFTYVLAAVWNPDANTETLIFGCPITGAVRTIHVFIDPTARTYRSSIQIVDYTIPQINDSSTSSSAVWSAQKIDSELAGKAEIDDDDVSSSTAWSSSRIASLLPTESASGAVANFETPLTLPLVSHIVTIEPVQAGTGDPSPSNVRPISGWNAVKVTRTGKNIFNLLNLAGTGITISSGVASGTVGDFYNNFQNSQGGIPNLSNFKANTQYTLSLWYKYENNSYSGNSLGIRVNYTDGTNSVLFYTNIQTTADYSLITGTTTAGKTVKNLAINYGTGAGLTIFLKDIQLEENATATTYEAYNGTTVTIVLGQTVYVGTLDVKNGVLTITGVKVKPTTQSNISGSVHTSNNVWAFTLSEEQAIYAAQVPILSSINNSMGYTVATDSGFCMALAAGKPIFALADSDSGLDANSNTTQILNAFHTFVETYSPEAVYPLTTPVEIALTPEQINTLKGVNNIWADTGDTAVEFKQDIQTYIDNRLSSGTRTLSLAKSPVETKEETKQEEQEGDENVDR